MFRTRLSLAFAALLALVCVQAAFVYWGAYRVNDYARHSRLTSDILSELLDLSANKQRLRAWAMQRLMNADAVPEVRERLIENMQRSATALESLAVQDAALWRELAERDGIAVPQEVHQLVGVSELLKDNIKAVDARLKPLTPLEPGAEFAVLWGEINQVFDMAKGRDLREVLNGAIDRQRLTVPVARAATERALAALREKAIAMALITLAAAIVMALSLSRRLQQPLDRLLAGTQALQVGALDHRIATGSRDEFDHVAQSFNAMAQELQSHRSAADAARHDLEVAVHDRTRELSAA
ncbi:MAG: HAMP domain-containing protein, partial [Acidovorax sp.]